MAAVEAVGAAADAQMAEQGAEAMHVVAEEVEKEAEKAEAAVVE